MLRPRRLRTRTRPGTPPRRIVVLGGARSGKSEYAERLVAAAPAVTYVATSSVPDDDADWRRRVDEHRARRPASWLTVEDGDLAAVLTDTDGRAVLVDDIATWLARVMDDARAWDEPSDAPAVDAAVERLVSAWRGCGSRRTPVVLVSAETGLGVVPATRSGAAFRDRLGRLNQQLSAYADEVWIVVAGLPHRLCGPGADHRAGGR